MKAKLLAVPYTLWTFIFIVIPTFLVLLFALTDEKFNFTLSNIINVGHYSNVFLRSIWLGAVATFICLLLGFPLAYIISKMDEKKQGILMMLIMLPMWMNFLLRTYAWMTILEYNGLINRLFSLVGLGPFEMINTQGAVVLGMVYNFLPYMILPIYSVVVKLDRKIIEAAEDLGANKFQIFMRVILPLSAPGIISGVTMVFVPSVSTFIISKMLGGGANILIGDLIDMQFLGNSYNPHMGSAISLVLMLLIMVCIGITNQFSDDEEGSVMI